MTKLRWITRDGERILQSHEEGGSIGWVDVPLHRDPADEFDDLAQKITEAFACDDRCRAVDIASCTRVEVIDHMGRSYVSWKDDNKVSIQLQDGGKTLKVFITKHKGETSGKSR